jgi:hypothetical protein
MRTMLRTRLAQDIAALAMRVTPPVAPMTRLGMAEALGFRLDPWQHDVLTSEARQLLLNVCRQGGKSTISALLGLHTALARDNQLVLIVSPGERQSQLLFKQLLRFYHGLGRPIPARTENVLSLTLANGSEIHALPGDEDRVRGFSDVDLILADEAARIPDQMMAAMRPMLAISGGRLIAMSTPWGKRGWWYDAWAHGGADWQRFAVPWHACPRIAPEFIEQERRALPDIWFRSEYCCEFTAAEDAYFDHASIARAFDSALEPLFPVEEAPLHG